MGQRRPFLEASHLELHQPAEGVPVAMDRPFQFVQKDNRGLSRIFISQNTDHAMSSRVHGNFNSAVLFLQGLMYGVSSSGSR